MERAQGQNVLLTFAHLQKLILAALQSDSLWVFSDEEESDKALPLHENTTV